MKKAVFVAAALLLAAVGASAAGIETVAYNELVMSISRAKPPVVSGRFVVFTATGTARHAGISFEHENYSTIHSLKRLTRRDESGKPRLDETKTRVDSVLFFIAEVPPSVDKLRYRMVIDGLWTVDPLNDSTEYDYPNGIRVSTVAVERYETFETKETNRGLVRFTYTARSGSTIRLAGSFNNWDSFMYEMEETAPGRYELYLPLPRGTWYYAFFEGMSQLPDLANEERVYTKDGRIASVVRVD